MKHIFSFLAGILIFTGTTAHADQMTACYQSANPNNTISFINFLRERNTGVITVNYNNHVILLKPVSINISLLSNGSTVTLYGEDGITDVKDAVLFARDGSVTWQNAGGIVFDVCN